MMKQTPHAVVKIEYGVMPNGNTRVGGFLPLVRVNGKSCGDTWSAKGYDADAALSLAKAGAQEEADRYLGEWEITIAAITTDSTNKES